MASQKMVRKLFFNQKKALLILAFLFLEALYLKEDINTFLGAIYTFAVMGNSKEKSHLTPFEFPSVYVIELLHCCLIHH